MNEIHSLNRPGVNLLAATLAQSPAFDAAVIKPNYLSLDAPGSNTAPDAPLDFFAAVQQQLGLKLKPTKGSVEILVVDHADRAPTEN